MSLPILNIDTFIPKDNPIVLQENVPRFYGRTMICGRSGCGKTTVLLSLFFLNYIYYDAVYLYYKNRTEDKYRALIKFFQEINIDRARLRKRKAEELDIEIEELEESLRKNDGKDYGIGENEARQLRDIIYEVGHSLDEVKPLEDFERNNDESKRLRNLQKVAIFDDFLNEKDQTIIKQYFIYSRKNKFLCFYLAQTVHKVPQVIRSNSTEIILFKHTDREFLEIYKSFAGALDKETFREIYNEATCKEFGFLYIRLDVPLNDMFRIGYSDPIEFEEV